MLVLLTAFFILNLELKFLVGLYKSSEEQEQADLNLY